MKSRILVLITISLFSLSSIAENAINLQLKEVLEMWGKSYRKTEKASCPQGAEQLQKKHNATAFAIECKLPDGLVAVVEGKIHVAHRMHFENSKFSKCNSEAEIRSYLSQFGGELRINSEPDMKKFGFMIQGKVNGENKKEMFWLVNGFCMKDLFDAGARTYNQDQFKSGLHSDWKK